LTIFRIGRPADLFYAHENLPPPPPQDAALGLALLLPEANPDIRRSIFPEPHLTQIALESPYVN
jgi:hypothetical protein